MPPWLPAVRGSVTSHHAGALGRLISQNRLTVFNGKLYFQANGGTNGLELWAYDGTSASEVQDINPGAGAGSNPVSARAPAAHAAAVTTHTVAFGHVRAHAAVAAISRTWLSDEPPRGCARPPHLAGISDSLQRQAVLPSKRRHKRRRVVGVRLAARSSFRSSFLPTVSAPPFDASLDPTKLSTRLSSKRPTVHASRHAANSAAAPA